MFSVRDKKKSEVMHFLHPTLDTVYKKEDVVLLSMRQLSRKDQNDTNINNYR